MSEHELKFDNDAIAAGYDSVLAPVLFEPWADALLDDHQPWQGLRVLDLAAGTGVVTQRLGRRVGSDGEVVGIDINGTMLDRARARCEDAGNVRLLEGPADALACDAGSIDVVVCQQGFQFFPDKPAAAREIFRVLREGGRVVATTWCPIETCEFFAAFHDALEVAGDTDAAAAMRGPFDFLSPAELSAPFAEAGFADVAVRQIEKDMVLEGGLAQANEFAYATPVGPQLLAMTDERQATFREAFRQRLGPPSEDGATRSRMVSNELSARKPG